MKKILLSSALCFLMATTGLLAQIKIITNGNVGINNTSPVYKLDVGGTMRMTASGYSVVFDGSTLYPTTNGGTMLGSYSYFWNSIWSNSAYFMYDPVIMSDKEFKSDITDLSDMKQKLNLLRPVSYNLNFPLEAKSDTNNLVKPSTFQYGFIAQEVKEIFPNIVVDRGDGKLGIMYSALIPVIVQVIKEQQSEIDQLKQQIIELQSKIK